MRERTTFTLFRLIPMIWYFVGTLGLPDAAGLHPSLQVSEDNFRELK